MDLRPIELIIMCLVFSFSIYSTFDISLVILLYHKVMAGEVWMAIGYEFVHLFTDHCGP